MSITRINTNYDALFSSVNLKKIDMQLQNAMKRISTGKRINSAADDPAGIGTLTVAKAQLSGTRVAQRNAQDDLAMLQFADGVMDSFENSLNRLREIAVRRANEATLSTAQVTALADEWAGIVPAADGLIGSTAMNAVSWNGKTLFDGTHSGANELKFHIASGSVSGGLALELFALNSTTVTDNAGLNSVNLATALFTTAAEAATAVGTLDSALSNLASTRGQVGITMRMIDLSLDNMMTMEINYASTVSSIEDADLAAEISKLTTAQILSQAATAMLGQANIGTQTLMSILM